MRIYFVDDSNIAKEERLEFFLYGGIILEESLIRNIAKDFLEIKKNRGISDDTEIKWDNVNKLDPSEQKDLKDDILKLVKETDCNIITYLAPQDFYHENVLGTQNGERQFKYRIDKKKQIKALRYATNVCLQKYNNYLEEINERGLVIADEAGGCKKEIIKHWFSIYPRGTDRNALERLIYMTIPVDSQYSLVHQINDVVLGAIQHSLKEYRNNFLPILKNKLWAKTTNGQSTIIGYGFNVYPLHARTQWMQKMLERVKGKFSRRI